MRPERHGATRAVLRAASAAWRASPASTSPAASSPGSRAVLHWRWLSEGVPPPQQAGAENRGERRHGRPLSDRRWTSFARDGALDHGCRRRRAPRWWRRVARPRTGRRGRRATTWPSLMKSCACVPSGTSSRHQVSRRADHEGTDVVGVQRVMYELDAERDQNPHARQYA